MGHRRAQKGKETELPQPSQGVPNRPVEDGDRHGHAVFARRLEPPALHPLPGPSSRLIVYELRGRQRVLETKGKPFGGLHR